MEVIDLCDTTVEEDDFGYAMDTSTGFKGFSALGDSSNDDSDDDFVLPNLAEIRSSIQQPSRTKRANNKRRTLESDVIDLEDTPPEDVAPPKKRVRKAPAQTAVEKQAKAAEKKAEAERKKREKEAEKVLKAQQKIAEKTQKEAQKEAEKVHNTLNTLVNSKGETLVDLVLQIPRALWISPTFSKIVGPLEVNLKQEYEKATSKPPPPTWEPVVVKELHEDAKFGGIDNIITWKKHIYARYDEVNKQWEPIPEPDWHVQGVYLMYFNMLELLRIYRRNPNEISRRLRVLRRVLGRHHQLFIMIEGFHSSASTKKFENGEKAELEMYFVRLQLEYNCFIIHSPKQASSIDWLCSMTGDIGRRPHKLIENSHLPFYSRKDGVERIPEKDHKSTSGTYQNMLSQIKKVSPELINNLVSGGFPTLRSFFEAYQDPALSESDKELMHVGIPLYKESGARRTTVGPVISRRIHAVFTGDNGLNLIGGK